MSIETQCQNCDAILTVSDEHAGGRARCPKCMTEYDIPAANDLEELASTCHFCGIPIDTAPIDTAPIDTAPTANGSAEDEPYNICEECRESIEINQQERIEEAQTGAQNNRRFLVALIFSVAVLLAMFLLNFLFNDS